MASPSNPAEPLPRTETRLTFGVELEFILATVAEGKENPNPQDPREVNGKILSDHDSINYHICKKLEEAGIQAIVQKTDITVGLSDPDEKDGRYTEFGLEMSSPPYYYDEASQKAVATVLKVFRNNYLVRVDKTTGFHVHVGNSYDGLQWRPLRKSTLGLRHPELTRLEFLNRILSFTNNQQIISELTGTEDKTRLGFNIRNLKTPFSDQNAKRTIEFRHHPGSLAPKDILHWVHICVKMVGKAFFIKDEELLNRLRIDVEKPIGFEEDSVSTIDYLMWLGCPIQAYYYGGKMIANKAQIEKRIKEEAKKDAMDLVMYREEGHVDVQGRLSLGMSEEWLWR